MASSLKGGALEIASDFFRVLTVPTMGRGLFATGQLTANTVVHREAPFVSTPPVSKVRDGSWCPACCSPDFACGHHREPSSVDFSALHAYCESKRFKWPLLMAKLAMRKLREDKANEDQALARIQLLCSVNLAGRERWLEEQRRVLVGCFERSGIQHAADVLTIDWYIDTYSRIQPNAFRLDLVDTPVLQRGGDYQAVLRGMLARQEGDEAGSAVYTIASLFNHSCAPNINVGFPKNDHVITLRTNQDVGEHEQLTISYIDLELDVDERARRLAMYGFTCDCVRCREERK